MTWGPYKFISNGLGGDPNIGNRTGLSFSIIWFVGCLVSFLGQTWVRAYDIGCFTFYRETTVAHFGHLTMAAVEIVAFGWVTHPIGNINNLVNIIYVQEYHKIYREHCSKFSFPKLLYHQILKPSW